MESTKTPEISVIIPVYKAERHIEQTLDSVLAQTFKDYEIICVDDGSPDNSLEILKRYEEKDERIRVVSQENAGAGAARNHGLREAAGKYLLFLDADDFVEPELLEKAHAQAEKDDSDFVVFNSDQYYDETGEFQAVPWVVRLRDIPPYNPFKYRQLTDNVFKTFVGWAWDKLYRHSFVTEHDLWFQEQRTTNDMLFVFSALVLAQRISLVNEVLIHQRREKGSLSTTREKSWFCFYDALTALRQRLKDEGLYEELERDFINYALHFSLWNLDTLAQPTKGILEEKLIDEWFEDLGIKGKPKDYFYNKNEYDHYSHIMKL